MPLKQETVEKKLNNIVNSGKPSSITHEGKRFYISKQKINDVYKKQKDGGIFPLIPILLGIGAAASVGGATAGIVKAANDKAANDISLKQQKTHDDKIEKLLKGSGIHLSDNTESVTTGNGVHDTTESDTTGNGIQLSDSTGSDIYLPEYQKGNGFSDGIKAFAKESGLNDEASKLLRMALKPLSNKLNVMLKGNGLILTAR